MSLPSRAARSNSTKRFPELKRRATTHQLGSWIGRIKSRDNIQNNGKILSTSGQWTAYILSVCEKAEYRECWKGLLWVAAPPDC